MYIKQFAFETVMFLPFNGTQEQDLNVGRLNKPRSPCPVLYSGDERSASGTSHRGAGRRDEGISNSSHIICYYIHVHNMICCLYFRAFLTA